MSEALAIVGALGATSGETPETACSCELSLNAKGHVQFALKLRYASVDEMLKRMDGDMRAAIQKVRFEVAGAGMQLAGS